MTSDIDVVDEIKVIEALQQGHSIVRYGDGEFQLIFTGGLRYIKQVIKGNKPQVFGNGGLWLSWRLRKILLSNQEKLLIGIPNVFFDGAEKIWKSRFFYENKQNIVNLLNSDKVYYSSFFTRYNRRLEHCDTHWERIQNIWVGKSITIVNFDSNIVNNIMFQSAEKTKFIPCRKQNVWGYGFRYRKLLKKCRNADTDMILLVAGPVATLLAYDLCKQGKHCIDLGQLTRMHDRITNS